MIRKIFLSTIIWGAVICVTVAVAFAFAFEMIACDTSTNETEVSTSNQESLPRVEPIKHQEDCRVILLDQYGNPLDDKPQRGERVIYLFECHCEFPGWKDGK